jgi:hypothetical protein
MYSLCRKKETEKMEKDKFLRWNVITNVLMALSINSTAVLLAGGDSLPGWVRGCCCAFTINTIAAAIIPVGAIGKWFAETICKRTPGTVTEMIARNFIINAIYVTIISFCMALLVVGFSSDLIPVWLSTYPILHLVGFVTSLVIEKPVNAVVYGPVSAN